MLQILVDADSCPVKEEIYKVSLRHDIAVSIVSNSHMRIPNHRLVKHVLASSNFDAADDYIAENASPSTVVVTADILLAQRCLKERASVIAPNGKPFTASSIGTAVANRALMEDLRAGGEQVGGPPPFSKKDRSQFLSTLHETLLRLKRAQI